MNTISRTTKPSLDAHHHQRPDHTPVPQQPKRVPVATPAPIINITQNILVAEEFNTWRQESEGRHRHHRRHPVEIAYENGRPHADFLIVLDAFC